MTIVKSMSRKVFAAEVVRQLEKNGISCVLVGGACVSIYSDEKHASRDLDFISPYSHEAIAKALEEIGFRKEGRYFHHPNSSLYVEFPSGPVAIGEQSPVKPEGKMMIDGTAVIMFSPTQCVMDRLAAWFHWNDRRSLIHALWVCEKQPVSIEKIKRWARKEGQSDKLEQFVLEYKKTKARQNL